MQWWHKGRIFKNTTPILIHKQTDNKEEKKEKYKQIEKGTPVQSTLEAWRVQKTITPRINNNTPRQDNTKQIVPSIKPGYTRTDRTRNNGISPPHEERWTHIALQWDKKLDEI